MTTPTQKAALDALENLTKILHDCEGHQAFPQMETLRAFIEAHPDAAPEKVEGRDWPEDFSHENGNYQCQCCQCKELFVGHKRRVVCKSCSSGHVAAPSDKERAEALEKAVYDFHWMARRYADGRSSYAPSLLNDHVRKLQSLGISFKKPLFARDGMGRRFDGLSDVEVQEAEADMPIGHEEVLRQTEERIKAALSTPQQAAPDHWKPISSAPTNGEHFYVRELIPMRFKPYSPKSAEFKRGIKGRWQRMNDYGGWDNCPDAQPYEWCTNQEGNAMLSAAPVADHAETA